jgi:hypothetical protein
MRLLSPGEAHAGDRARGFQPPRALLVWVRPFRVAIVLHPPTIGATMEFLGLIALGLATLAVVVMYADFSDDD